MDTYFEMGDYAAVQQIGQRMLDWHPNLLAERPGMLFRVAMADQLCGNLDAAQHLLDELKSKFANATGQVRGSDVVLADVLDAQLKSDIPPGAWIER